MRDRRTSRCRLVPDASGAGTNIIADSRSLEFVPYLLTQSLHQPWLLTGPSTSWQEDGEMNSLQFAQL
jgi:hypothetical protein